MDTITVIGIMSGTSVDGLDIVAAEFVHSNEEWNYKLIKSRSYDYPSTLRNKLIHCIDLSARDLAYLDHELGSFIAAKVNDFCRDKTFTPVLIASHGHTVFHQPEKRLTCQIGDGQVIFNITRIPTINDFRIKDVLKGGQGAPLVPVGDKFLFHEYGYCINIGGFANVSFDNNEGKRIAYDICPANIVLNHLARKTGLSYDDQGRLARGGKLISGLLTKLNRLDYYNRSYPKSLGLEWVKGTIFPLLEKGNENIPDLLHTCTVHIAFQVSKALENGVSKMGINKNTKVLITGGGAYNKFLVDLIRESAGGKEIIIPERRIIDFKEAIIFAFLGLLRYKRMNNIWGSVTGAESDSSAGVIHD